MIGASNNVISVNNFKFFCLLYIFCLYVVATIVFFVIYCNQKPKLPLVFSLRRGLVTGQCRGGAGG